MTEISLAHQAGSGEDTHASQSWCSPKHSNSLESSGKEVAIFICREFPTVETFVEEKAAKFAGLTVEYRFGSAPRLVLRGGKGQKESLRVDRWKTEHIEEFLTDKLQVKSAA